MSSNKHVPTPNYKFSLSPQDSLHLSVSATLAVESMEKVPLEDIQRDQLFQSLFYIDLASPPLTNLSAYYYLLADEEQEKCRRFMQAAHQQRFAWGRIALRKILGLATQKSPESLVFAKGEYRKPFLNDKDLERTVHFSLSYSGSSIVLVFDTQPIGVDIEGVKTHFDVSNMQEAVCAEEEIAYLEGLSEEERQKAFFTLWTRKEALLKWSGKGIGMHISQCSLLEGERSIAAEIIGASSTGQVAVASYDYAKNHEMISLAQSSASSSKIPTEIVL